MKFSFRDIICGILDVLYPEPIPWRSEEEWQELLRILPRTEQMSLQDNLTEDTILHEGESLEIDDEHRRRQRIAHRLVRAAAFLWYEHDGIVPKLIHRGKFGANAEPQILARLAREAAYEMLYTDFLEDIDLIVPLPLHKKRLRERGFNQAEVIARAISEVTGIPVDTTNLVRIRNNEHQSRLHGSERQQNANGAFMLARPEDYHEFHVLLIDDVITTGSTIRAAIEAFFPVRKCKITVFALAKAIHRQPIPPTR